MSFCPKCGAGSGNGGEVCARCEAMERRETALTEEAAHEFRTAFHQHTPCAACTRYSMTAVLADEPLCEECFINAYVEDGM